MELAPGFDRLFASVLGEQRVSEITVTIQGLDTVLARLRRLGAKASSSTVWRSVLSAGIERFRAYAAEISPVVTGSYQASHRTKVEGRVAQMYIDPAARNTDSGVLVTRYAGFVEDRHAVYLRTAEQAPRVIADVVADVIKEIAE